MKQMEDQVEEERVSMSVRCIDLQNYKKKREGKKGSLLVSF